MHPSTVSELPPYYSAPISHAPLPSSSSVSLPATLQAPGESPTHRRTVRFQAPDYGHKNKARSSLSKQQNDSRISSGPGTVSSQSLGAAPLSDSQGARYGGPPAERLDNDGTMATSLAGAALIQSPPGNEGGSRRASHTKTGSGSGPPGNPPSYFDSNEQGSVNASNVSSGGSSGAGRDDGQVVRPSLLQPRVAALLGLPRLWHLPLFACRLLSMCPAIWWSLGIFIRLLTQLHALAVARSGFGGLPTPGGVGSRELAGMAGSGSLAAATASGLGSLGDRGAGLSLESRLKLTETGLAMIWCGASAYLSFFFTDCLMSRWLLNYTPQATIVRLLAINALNGYLTSWVIFLMGSGGDSRLLLPAWVAIAAILTGLYHGTQRKINIRKETSISISVFSGASFISMVSLLAQLYWDRPEYVDVPVVALARRVCAETARVAGNVFDIGNITLDL
ncbi:hypothetical protein SEPCBS119000_003953 [Sporothrix epigloea]|uniref:N-glycosylation protein EOS1 n=1 Tax=Sporothrix epigloea TaxID=1892477 RepID=A0ABP0DT57_9PEZI